MGVIYFTNPIILVNALNDDSRLSYVFLDMVLNVVELLMLNALLNDDLRENAGLDATLRMDSVLVVVVSTFGLWRIILFLLSM